MTTQTAQSNEKRVQAVWRICGVRHEEWRGYVAYVSFYELAPRPTEAAAWSAAWEYTEAVMEEVRQLKEEISTITHEFKKASVCGVGMGPLQGRALVWSRILARLQSLLATKSAGMKPEAL